MLGHSTGLQPIRPKRPTAHLRARLKRPQGLGRWPSAIAPLGAAPRAWEQGDAARARQRGCGGTPASATATARKVAREHRRRKGGWRGELEVSPLPLGFCGLGFLWGFVGAAAARDLAGAGGEGVRGGGGEG